MKTLEIKVPGMPVDSDTTTIPVHKTAGKGNLGWTDAAQGAITAAISAGLLVIQQALAVGVMKIDWKNVALISLGAGVAYLIKNVFKEARVVIKAKDLV